MEYVGKADPDRLVETLWVPFTEWWDEGPGEVFHERGFVAIVCGPGDMTHYELLVADLSDSGFRGRPKLGVAFTSPCRYQTMTTSSVALWGVDDFHACDRANVPEFHVVARALLSAVVRSGMRGVSVRMANREAK